MTKATEVMISDLKDILIGQTIIDFQYREDKDYYVVTIDGKSTSHHAGFRKVPTTMVIRFMSDIDKDFKITDDDRWIQDKMNEIDGYLETMRGK